MAWTNAPSGSYKNGRFHEPPRAEFSPTDHPHFYLFWELLRPKYSLTPTPHGQPCMSSKGIQETSWPWVQHSYKTWRAQDHQPSQIWRDRSPVSRQRRLRNSILWNRQSKRVIKFLKGPFHVRNDVEMELKRLKKLDIIETATGQRPGWALLS